MKPEITEVESGRIVSWRDGKDVYYVGGGTMNGVAFKDRDAFNEHYGICYIPEYGFFDEVGIDENVSDEMLEWMNEDNCGYVGDASCGFTRDEIYATFYDHIDQEDWVEEKSKVYGKAFVESFIDNEVEYIFGELDWQFPFTFMQEMEWEEDWEEFIKQKS